MIPMDHRYLAAFDGSEQAQGRGSGRETPGRKRSTKNFLLPYMSMTFAPLERRLDTAIFRALFASSARQARQFVVHGAVKVNGKKVCRSCGPGYSARLTQTARWSILDISLIPVTCSKSTRNVSCTRRELQRTLENVD